LLLRARARATRARRVMRRDHTHDKREIIARVRMHVVNARRVRRVRVVVAFVRTNARTRAFRIDVQRATQRCHVERFVVIVAHVIERDFTRRNVVCIVCVHCVSPFVVVVVVLSRARFDNVHRVRDFEHMIRDDCDNDCDERCDDTRNVHVHCVHHFVSPFVVRVVARSMMHMQTTCANVKKRMSLIYNNIRSTTLNATTKIRCNVQCALQMRAMYNRIDSITRYNATLRDVVTNAHAICIRIIERAQTSHVNETSNEWGNVMRKIVNAIRDNYTIALFIACYFALLIELSNAIR
jgi:hypothetical protein